MLRCFDEKTTPIEPSDSLRTTAKISKKHGKNAREVKPPSIHHDGQ
jgi:hypothetical protein